MNKIEEQCYNYIIERTKNGCEAQVDTLLQTLFKKQQEGCFHQLVLLHVHGEISSCIKTEDVADVMNLLREYEQTILKH